MHLTSKTVEWSCSTATHFNLLTLTELHNNLYRKSRWRRFESHLHWHLWQHPPTWASWERGHAFTRLLLLSKSSGMESLPFHHLIKEGPKCSWKSSSPHGSAWYRALAQRGRIVRVGEGQAATCTTSAIEEWSKVSNEIKMKDMQGDVWLWFLWFENITFFLLRCFAAGLLLRVGAVAS